MTSAGSNRTASALERPFERADTLIASALFLFGLILYVVTLAPSVLWGDSGEFQVISAAGGLAHASGYPIYLIIGKLFTFLPFGSIAYRVNLLSAVSGASAGAGIYFLSKALGSRRVFAAIAAVAFLINPLIWWQSVIAEVYMTTAAFFVGFLLCAVMWRRERSPRWLLAGAVLGGLCFGLHHTVVLTLPAVLLYLAFSKAKGKEWGIALLGAAGGLLISLVTYVALASANAKTSSINSIKWSASAYNTTTESFGSPLAQVKFLVLAKQWSQNVFHIDPALAKSSSTWYWNETISDFGWVVTILAIVGIIGMFATRKRTKDVILLLGSWLILFYFILTFNPFDLEVDFIPTYTLVAVFAALGLQFLQELISRKPVLAGSARPITAVAACLAVVIGSWSILGGSLNALSKGRPDFLTEIRRVYPYPIEEPDKPLDYGKDVVSRVEDGALIVTQWHYLYPCYYAGYFEQNKTNIEVVEAVPFGSKHMSDSLREYIRTSCDKRPVYVTTVPRIIADQYDFIPVTGRFPLYRLRPR